MDLTILLRGIIRSEATGYRLCCCCTRPANGQASVMNKCGCVCLFRWMANVEK